MKNSTTTTWICAALALGITSSVFAGEKKNPPRNTKAVEKILEEAGPEHMPEKMRISKVGPVEVGETYFHVYCGTTKKDGYRIIFFNNTPKYLGYYATEYEPVDYEEGAILFDTGDSDNYSVMRISAKGPGEKASIEGAGSVKFVKAPVPKPTEVKSADGSTVVAEYRTWTITLKGKKIPFRAIYIKTEKGTIFLKDEKRGIEKGFPASSLSKEDLEYVKQFITK